MKSSRFVSSALCALLVLGTASVWAGGKADAAKPADTAKPAAPAAKAADIAISWQVWITPNLTRTYYDEVVAAFEAKNPGIKVKIVEANAATSGAANDFIKMRLAAGDVPDVWTNLDVAVFAEAGQLWEIPVNDPDLKKINGNPMDAAYKGKVYSFFPSVQPQGCMFYNKTMFKTAGITTLPKTWVEFEAACARLADAGIPLGSQTVLLKGVNDNISALKTLMHGLLKIRVKPYYLYQCDPIPGSSHFRTPVSKGLEMIQGLRGHTSGYAVPTFAIDAPGGGGKIPLLPEYVIGRDENGIILRNYEGRIFCYPDKE